MVEEALIQQQVSIGCHGVTNWSFIMSYTSEEYTQKACEANAQNKFLYVLVDKETKDETLLIGDIDYYICFENNKTYGDVNPNYEQELFLKAKEHKLSELNDKFNDAIENGHMTCSFGVEIDANNDALRNVGNLLLVMGADDKEMFCDYNNQFHELTRIQVELLQKEIIGYIKGLYAKKWSYREQINTLTTAKEIDSIVIEF